eukprot:CAMPEP_0119101466 /NCGR_PEP_ID=MMETSP1180-20130426/510_1 /TAXON_ID=3052 ORGANISM="Chlamydomonas cf sp, Strain CCMP681" /NCGR_SAMPLE_ID=MMETSP1180 /ASSEMBLY_ACC=CAM_ASM_000741 /LENGTH=132 /DNA_ID=CAMNT_0007085591 /DNA_START=585 /DNA_END=984 /DNA_ORIENTATION=-
MALPAATAASATALWVTPAGGLATVKEVGPVPTVPSAVKLAPILAGTPCLDQSAPIQEAYTLLHESLTQVWPGDALRQATTLFRTLGAFLAWARWSGVMLYQQGVASRKAQKTKKGESAAGAAAAAAAAGPP